MGNLLDLTLRDLEKVIYYSNYVVIDPGEQEVRPNQLLDEDEFLTLKTKAREEGDAVFMADIGAPAVRELLRRLDVDKVADDLRAQVAVETSQHRKKQQLKRLKIVDAFRNSGDFRKLCSAFPYKPWHGKVIGEHRGAHYYTVGQRKGLNIGGHTDPLFVLGTDVNRNILYVGEGTEHPGLYRPGLFIPRDEIHWIRTDLVMKVGESRSYDLRIRYRQPLEKAILFQREEGIYILFDDEQRGITSGQFAAWYEGDELIGSGVIA
jgi:tRNA U34 2-thiouridine synthase MnmA/TrmU